jgi:hypothetical protein
MSIGMHCDGERVTGGWRTRPHRLLCNLLVTLVLQPLRLKLALISPGQALPRLLHGGTS